MKIVKSQELNNDNDFYRTATIESHKSAVEIIEDVKHNGDDAIIKYCRQFGDGDFLNSNDFLVNDKEIDEAFNITSEKTVATLKKCIENVKNFAQEQLKCIKNLDLNINDSHLGHRIIPIERVLCYVPGGNYPLPSSAIMTTIPAKVAGVKEICLTSPKIKPQTITNNIANAK